MIRGQRSKSKGAKHVCSSILSTSPFHCTDQHVRPHSNGTFISDCLEINKFRIRKNNILLCVSFLKYILRNSRIVQTKEALHKMSLPVKVRQRQLHMRMNVFILAGMFILIFMCPVMTVMASYTFMCHLKAPLSALFRHFEPSAPSPGIWMERLENIKFLSSSGIRMHTSSWIAASWHLQQNALFRLRLSLLSLRLFVAMAETRV